jgi:EAL and modified HD-GYP domain-containing signal transduction protein
MVVLPILNMVSADDSFTAIANALRNEPVLTYKLLRHLKSPAMGLQVQIDNLTQALVVIGRAQFYRWMSLLLFDFTNPSYRERALSERALTRGRTTELLAGRGRIPNKPDPLFLAGLFSLLDQVLNLPLDELLEKTVLPEELVDALLYLRGPLGNALTLAILGDADRAPDPARMASTLLACGIDYDGLSVTAAQALIWAHTALGETE